MDDSTNRQSKVKVVRWEKMKKKGRKEGTDGGMCLQDKGHREVPASSRSEEEERKDPPLESSERASPCGHRDVRLLVSQAVREHIPLV